MLESVVPELEADVYRDWRLKCADGCLVFFALFSSLVLFGSGEFNLSRHGFVIDSHIHYRPTDEWKESFIEVFDKWNAIGCVLVRMQDLDRGIPFAKANPRRVIP